MAELSLSEHEISRIADAISQRLRLDFSHPGPKDSVDGLVDRRTAAQVLGISTKSLDRLVRSGKIPSVRIGARGLRFELQQVREALNQSS